MAIDYSAKNMVHADTSREEFAQMQQQRGETTATLFARAMQAQMTAQMSNHKAAARRGNSTRSGCCASS